MSGKPQYEWPTEDEFVALVREHGSLVDAADKLTPRRSRSTVESWVRERGSGLRSRIAQARVEHRSASRTESEPGDGVPEVDMLRQEVTELRTALRTGHKANVLEQRILARIEEGIQSAKPRYSPLVVPKGAKSEEHEFALLFSDTHAAEVVTSEGTLGMNSYDWDVMLKRMGRLQKSVLSYQANRPYPIRKLHVWMLGDMLSGDIHEELSQTNDRTLEEAAVQFGLDSAKWLEEFIPHFKDIEVAGVPGNHPRRSKKPSAKQPFNNADWTAYQVARCYHRLNPSITWNLPLADFATSVVAGRWRALLMHGHGIRSTMPGIPFGGVMRRVSTLEAQFAKAKQNLDVVCLGHYHTTNAIEGVGTKTFINGSVKGLDEYSLNQFGSGRPPAQVLLTFHPKRGVTDMSVIDLEDKEPSGAPARALAVAA